MIYNKEEQMQAQQQYKKYMTISIVVIIVFAVVAFAFMARMTQWKGALFLSVGVCIAIFILTIYALPSLSYYKFVTDIVQGRSREIHGPILKADDKPVYKDNKLLFYEIWIKEDDVERMLLFDANKGNPELEAGYEAVFKVYENYIIDVKGKRKKPS
ncbi:MAG TPA: hypothetical protein VFD33_00275 [Bacillota bacterium]|nr:hypothetical protein [Bacillota bacterium]